MKSPPFAENFSDFMSAGTKADSSSGSQGNDQIWQVEMWGEIDWLAFACF